MITLPGVGAISSIVQLLVEGRDLVDNPVPIAIGRQPISPESDKFEPINSVFLSMSLAHQILEVSTDVTEAQLKRAYRKKALQYHPDVNPSPEAQERFLQISKAYELLVREFQAPVVMKSAVERTMAEFEQAEKDRKREAAKAWIREKRRREQEAFEASTAFKMAVGLKRLIVYLTVVLGALMIVVPIVTFILEVSAGDLNWLRGTAFLLIGGLGGFFIWSGLYLIKYDEN